MRTIVCLPVVLTAASCFAESVRWSYPPKAWPCWEMQRARAYTFDAGMNVGYPVKLADCLQRATFRTADGRTFVVNASACDGVPCVRDEGLEVRDEFGDWVACDIFEGTDETPPHRLNFPSRVIRPTVTNGLYWVRGEHVAWICCRAAKRPRLYVGESAEEALNEDPAGFEQPCVFNPTGRANEWRSSVPLAFAYYRISGSVMDTWIETDEAQPSLVGTYSGTDARRRRIWRASAETVRLCTRRFFVDAVKRDRLPWPGDDAIGFLADAATYRQADVARFTIDALGCAREDGFLDYSPWWVILNGLYRNLYGDLGYIRRRWKTIRVRTDHLGETQRPDGTFPSVQGRGLFIDWGERGNPTTAYNILMFAAFDHAAALARELGETADERRWRVRAERVRTGVFARAYDAQTGLLAADLDAPRGTVYRQANILAVNFGLVTGEKARRIADVLAADDLPCVGTTCMIGEECVALLEHGFDDVVRRRIDETWGEMVDRGFTTAFEHWWKDSEGADSYRYYGRPFGMALCHVFAAGPAYLLPRIGTADRREAPYRPKTDL